MSDIDVPGLKDMLWHKMRDDLKSLVPWFADNDLLLCPACCRPIGFQDISVEHIIPQQAVANDPVGARDAIPRNERSGMTLLCRKPLVYKDKRVPGNGCNGWKGKHYDRFLKDIVSSNILFKQLTSRHQIALFSAAYLGLFRKYGYQIALLPSGRLMRSQFFRPNSFLREMPLRHQMILAGAPPDTYSDDAREFWSEPFKIGIEREAACVVVRNFSVQLPLSRDPTIPLARALPYAPSRYTFRPDLTTAFD